MTEFMQIKAQALHGFFDWLHGSEVDPQVESSANSTQFLLQPFCKLPAQLNGGLEKPC